MNNTTDTYTLSVDRKPLLAALGRIQPVIPRHCIKPLLLGVRLEAADGKLKLSANDLSMHIQTSVHADGALPACLVPFEELAGRIKIMREDRCQLQYDPGKKRITLNGGACAHSINTWELADYPPLPSEPKGETLTLAGADLGQKLAIVLKAAATSPGRYSNDGVLLESDEGGARLAATDGRRLVVAELSKRSGGFRGQALLLSGLVKLLIKLLAKAPADTEICLLVDGRDDQKGEELPARLHISGGDWSLWCDEREGSFPEYRKVMPQSHSRFVVERAALVEAIRQVALASKADQRVLRLELSPRRI
jgi:DNA polymerase III subunit beta